MHTVMRLLDGNAMSVIISFTFCSAYLLWGYYVTLSEEYAFEWTIPQCVLTLRLIAVSFDVYDGKRDRLRVAGDSTSPSAAAGHRAGQSSGNSSSSNSEQVEGNHVTKSPPAPLSHSPPEPSASASLSCSSSAGLQCSPPPTSQSQSQSQSSSSASGAAATGGRGGKEDEWSGNAEAMSEVPSLLQMLAHSYFPASFLVGPQFGLKIYLDFVKEEQGFLSGRFVPFFFFFFFCFKLIVFFALCLLLLFRSFLLCLLCLRPLFSRFSSVRMERMLLRQCLCYCAEQ